MVTYEVKKTGSQPGRIPLEVIEGVWIKFIFFMCDRAAVQEQEILDYAVCYGSQSRYTKSGASMRRGVARVAAVR
jgi:hypothetical protein